MIIYQKTESDKKAGAGQPQPIRQTATGQKQECGRALCFIGSHGVRSGKEPSGLDVMEQAERGRHDLQKRK